MQNENIRIRSGPDEMEGVLSLAEDCIGVVLFASCDNGSRVTPPNDYVTSMLREARLATLWLDLSSAHEGNKRNEAGERHPHPAVALLAERLDSACDWLRQHDATADLPIGLYGSSRCATAALQLGAGGRRDICAIVSRGGCPEMASEGVLAKISVPTLLIVGGLDEAAVRTHRVAYAALRCKKRLEVIPGATRAFEEPGNPEVIARLARGWLLQHAHLRQPY